MRHSILKSIWGQFNEAKANMPQLDQGSRTMKNAKVFKGFRFGGENRRENNLTITRITHIHSNYQVEHVATIPSP